VANLTPAQIRAAQARGASSQVIPKQVEVSGLIGLAEQFKMVLASNHQSNDEVLDAIRSLTAVIASKESKDLNIGQLVEAVLSLKHDRQPLDIEMTFERDHRNMLKSPFRFTEVMKL